MASTVTPKTICERGVSSIWLRGSAEGSVDRSRKRRPSRGWEDLLAGKDMPTGWIGAEVPDSAAQQAISVRKIRGRMRQYSRASVGETANSSVTIHCATAAAIRRL